MCPDDAGIIEEVYRQDELLLQSGTVFECIYLLDDLKNYMDDLSEE